jgi:methionyl-tRNA formyltransferase
MNNKLNIALLCNNKMAIPALQSMIAADVLCTVATAENDKEVVQLFSDIAARHDLPFNVISKNNCVDELAEWIAETKPDMVFVMTFPWRIPVSVLSIPEFGFVNFHYGLLPAMRGADPIFESIRQRLPVAGTTVHVMNADFDAGPILLQDQIPLPPEYTYGMLSSQMAYLGDKMCKQLIQDIKENKELVPKPQDEGAAQYWPKISEEELWIRWDEMSCSEIMALVRSCNPILKGVPVIINGWKMGVSDVSEVNLQGDASAIVPGTILTVDMQNGLLVCCKDGKALKLEVVYTAEGVFPGYKLVFFGIAAGMVFGAPLPVGQ